LRITYLKLHILYLYTGLVVFVTYPSKNTSLKMTTKGDRNMQEVYGDFNIIDLYIFVCICWFYFHS